MDLIGSLTDVNNVRGITLNSQQIDLFNIIEQAQSHEDAVQSVYEYLDGILQANRLSKEMDSQRLNTAQKIKRVVEEKANSDHTFNYDTSKTLEEQNVSDIAKGIIILLFRDYWATEIQRNKIIAKQNYDRIKLEEKKKEKYNPNDIFKNKNTSTNDNKINQDVQEQLNEEYNKNLPMEVQKQNIFQRLISFIKKLIHK